MKNISAVFVGAVIFYGLTCLNLKIESRCAFIESNNKTFEHYMSMFQLWQDDFEKAEKINDDKEMTKSIEMQKAIEVKLQATLNKILNDK